MRLPHTELPFFSRQLQLIFAEPFLMHRRMICFSCPQLPAFALMQIIQSSKWKTRSHNQEGLTNSNLRVLGERPGFRFMFLPASVEAIDPL